MKFNDAISGAALLALAIAVLINIQSFPKIPGQNVGPAAFPGLLATLLAVCSVLLIVKGLRAHAGGEAWVTPGRWLRSWPHLRSFLVTVGSLLFFILTSDRIGFIPAATAVLVAMFLTLGVRRRWVLPIAVISVLVIHFVFYKGLRVPLPWGWLQPIAW